MRNILMALIIILIAPSAFAATYMTDNFDSYTNLNDVRANWAMGADGTTSWAYSATGGRNGTPCIVVHAAYPGGTAQYQMQRDPNPAGSFAEGYTRFYFKITDHTGTEVGSKFLKFHGQVVDDGYANYTFSLLVEGTGTGDGAGLQGDGACRFCWWRNSATCAYDTYSYNAGGRPDLTDGNWHYFECYIKENTDGNYDGEIRVWFDGVLCLTTTGIRMRNDANIRNIGEIGLWSYFYPNDTDDSNDDFYVYYDDVVVSDTYIGPADDSSAPTVTSATINTAGTTLTLAMSESVTNNYTTTVPTLSMSGGAVTATCNSCASGTSLTYTLSRTVYSGETGTYSWDVAANGVEDAAGNDLVDISGAAITNDSEQDTTPPTRGLNNMSSQNVNWH